MRFASVCSGILGAELAWEPLGWEPAWCAEIDPVPSRIIAHRRKDLLNYGDFTTIGPDAGPIDLLAGGTPCQSFSSAGARGGMDDERGNLSLEFAALAKRVSARWILWENVPGVLSSGDGQDFALFLRRLESCGYMCAWRVLDAQFFGLPQRRKRVWFVGYLGDWRPPAAVLFERPVLQKHVGSRRKGWKPSLGYSEEGTVFGFNLSIAAISSAGGFICNLVPTLLKDARSCVYIAGEPPRYLSRTECERAQGFPDGWTDVPRVSDKQARAALGNAWPVPVARWIGSRIDAVEKILRGQQ